MDFDISYDIILQIKNKGVKGLKRGIRGHDVERQGLPNICQRMREMDCEYIQLVLERSLDEFKKEYGLGDDVELTPAIEIFEDAWADVTIKDIAMG